MKRTPEQRREQVRRMTGPDCLEYGNTLAEVTRFVGRCAKCSTWISSRTRAHGSLGVSGMCDGAIVPRTRIVVSIWLSERNDPYAWRKATPQERREVLALTSEPEGV